MSLPQITKTEQRIARLKKIRRELDLEIRELEEELPVTGKPRPQTSFMDPRTGKAVKIKKGR